jgi:hypothetical protein
MKRILMLGTFLLAVGSFAFAEEKAITYEYPELGVSLLTPGGVNVMLGYSMNDFTVRASGMSLGKTFGLQAEFDYNLGKSNYYKNGPGVVLGYMDYSDESGNVHVTTNGKGVRGVVLGAHYFWNWGLFYSSLGLSYTAINPNTDPPVALLFNIGINYRFLHSGD